MRNRTGSQFSFFSICATDCVSLTLDGTDIQKVYTCKYIGIRINDQLTWRNHTDDIYNKLKQLTGIFYRLKSKLAYRWFQNIYYAFVYAYLFYGIEIYANTYVSYLDKLVKIHDKILRILLNQSVCAPVPRLYEMFGLLIIEKLYSLQVSMLVF